MIKELDPIDWYIRSKPTYKRLALKIENILKEIFELEDISYHMITSRSKEIKSLKSKIDENEYDDPINQIQDYAGIRIITYVEDEIKIIRKVVERIFTIDRPNSSDKSDALGIDKVGYKSVHYIASLKSDRLKLPEYKQFKNLCFEIQIRTILQHAWAEIEHDKNYKFSGKLPQEISRRFKLLAGSLEMADMEFNNISLEIDKISKGVKEATTKGNLNISLNSTSLSQFIITRFDKLIQKGMVIKPLSKEKLLKEMEDFGLHTLGDLNSIIPSDFEKVLWETRGTEIEFTETGLVRMVMIVNDYDKYFKKAFNKNFTIWGTDGKGKAIFDHYGVSWDDIYNKYKLPFDLSYFKKKKQA